MKKRKRRVSKRRSVASKPKMSAAHLRHEKEEERIFADFLRSIPAGHPTPAGPHVVVRKGRGWSIDGGPVMPLMTAAAALHGRYKRNPLPEFSVSTQAPLPFEEAMPPYRVVHGLPVELRSRPYELEDLGIPEDAMKRDLPPEVVDLLSSAAREQLEENEQHKKRHESKSELKAASIVIGNREAREFSEAEWDFLNPEQKKIAVENENDFLVEIQEAISEFADLEAQYREENEDLDYIETYFDEQLRSGNVGISDSQIVREVLDEVSDELKQYIDQNDLERNVIDTVDELLKEMQYWTFRGGQGQGDWQYDDDSVEGEMDDLAYSLPDRVLDQIKELKYDEEFEALYDLINKRSNCYVRAGYRSGKAEWERWIISYSYSIHAHADVNWNDVVTAVEEYYEDDVNRWLEGEGRELPSGTTGVARQLASPRAHVPHVFEFGSTRPDGSLRSEGYRDWYAVKIADLAELKDEAEAYRGTLCFNNTGYNYRKWLSNGETEFYSIRTPQHKSVFTLDVHPPALDCSSIYPGGGAGTHSPDCPKRMGTYHVSQIKGMGNRHAGMSGGSLTSTDEVEIVAQFVQQFLGIDPRTVSNIEDSLYRYEQEMEKRAALARGLPPPLPRRPQLHTMGLFAAELRIALPGWEITQPSDTTVMAVGDDKRIVTRWDAEKEYDGHRGAYIVKLSVQGQRGVQERLAASFYVALEVVRAASLGNMPQQNPRGRKRRNPSVLTGATQSRPIGKMSPPKATFWDFYESQKPSKPRKTKRKKGK